MTKACGVAKNANFVIIMHQIFLRNGVTYWQLVRLLIKVADAEAAKVADAEVIKCELCK